MTARFGCVVRETRIAQRLSLRCLAKELGVSAAYLSEIELNRRGTISYKLVRLVCKLLNIEDVDEMWALAQQERRTIRLCVDPNDELQRRVGWLLAKSWSVLDRDTLKQIFEVTEDA